METKTRVAFDIGFSSIGYAISKHYDGFENDLPVWGGVWLFDNENHKSEIAEIKRNKRRHNRKKERLKRFRDIANISLKDKKFIEASKKIWKIIEESKKRELEDIEVKAVLYHFLKKRGYIDMSKVEKKVDENENEDINAFEKVTKHRQKIINELEDKLVNNFNLDRDEVREFLERYIPYRNRQPYNDKKIDNKGIVLKVAEYFKLVDLKKIKNKEEKDTNEEKKYKLIKKIFNDINYITLTNKDIEKALKDILSIQKERFNKTFLNDYILEEYFNMLTFKGKKQSYEDRIGYCESGFKFKRSGRNTLDTEKFKLIERYFKMNYFNSNGEEKFIRDIISLDEFIKRILNENEKEINANKFKKIFKDIDIAELVNEKNFKIRLLAHYCYSKLKDKRILEDDEFRDEVEYTLLFYRDKEQRRELLKDKFCKEDLEKIIEFEIKETANYANKVLREYILPSLKEGQELQSIINNLKSKNIPLQKRKYLSFEEWKKNICFDNPYLENIVKNFIKLFNYIVQKFGVIDEVVIENARNFSLNKEDIQEMENIKNNNEKTNKIIMQFLEKRYKTLPENKNALIKRLKLFLEQNKSLKKLEDNSISYCPLTGEEITIEEALDGNKTNIDHIVPQSVFIDNSLNNLILISSKVNQKDKVDKTPLEWLIESKNISEEEAKEILKENLKKTKINLNSSKRKNFLKKAKEMKYGLREFNLNHLNTTHFAINEIKDLIIKQYGFNNEDDNPTYAKRASRVLTINGKLTSFLRRAYIPFYKKQREYYINHLIDALVLLNIDRSILQKIKTETNVFINKEIYKKEDYFNYFRKHILKEKKIEPLFDLKKAVKFFEEKFEKEELGVYREEVKKVFKKYFEDAILSPKEKVNKFKTPSGWRAKERGFKKIYVYENKKSYKMRIVNYFENENRVLEELKDKSIIATLYRYSLVYLPKEDMYGYVIGATGNTIEITPINRDKFERRMRKVLTGFTFGKKITPFGVVK